MPTKSSAINAIQTKVINTTSKVVPMHLQIQALKVVMKAKKKIIGRQRPLLNFVETPIPDVNTLALEDIDVSNPFLRSEE
ncbi:MAG: cytochrome P450, partial [Cyanobacteria bacterium PR.023]|nr:cytochrome P450 [Cyanobacteria bacterium PR.023]